MSQPPRRKHQSFAHSTHTDIFTDFSEQAKANKEKRI